MKSFLAKIDVLRFFAAFLSVFFALQVSSTTIFARELSNNQKSILNRNIPRFDLCEDNGSDETPEETDQSGSQPGGNYEYIEVGNIPKDGLEVGSSIYGGSYTGGEWKPSNGQQGGGNDDTGIGNHDNPLPGTTTYAELSNGGGNDYSALGGLPNGTKLEIKYKNKTIIAEKGDVGAGGGDVKGKPRAIDLWWEVVKYMDPEGSTELSNGVDVVEIHAVPKSTKVTDISKPSVANAEGDVTVSSCCAVAENADASLSGSNNNAKALNFFVSKGFTPHQAAGIVGNFIQESGGYNNGIIDPQIVEGGSRSKTVPPPTGPDGQPGYGIAQWTFPTRKENLKKFAAEKGKPVYSLSLQLEFVMHEMTDELEKDLKKIKGANRDAIEESALLFHRVYEGSADSAAQIQERVESGVKALENSGGTVSGSDAGTEGSCGGGGGASTGEMAWPIDGPVTTCYGVIPSRGRLHSGLDIAAPQGEKVAAADGGKVVDAGNLDPAGFGNTVIIRHDGGKWTLYGHLASVSVKKGDKVDQGQEIGKNGSSGSSTGPHLHFNVMKEGTTSANISNTVNPLDVLPSDGRQMNTGDGKCVPGDKGFK